MDISSLKLGFCSYLQELYENTDKNINADEFSAVSIFMYSSEFKDYLVEEVGADVSVFSKSVSDLLNMEIKNGKLVEPESELNPENESEDDEDLMTALLNDLLEDEEFSSSIDTDKNNEISNDEFGAFIKSAAESDESNQLTFDGLSKAVSSNIQTVENESSQKQEQTVEDILAKAYNNKSVIAALDENGDNILSDEEKAKFEEFIKGYDGDASDLSVSDIKSAVSSIIDGKFSYDKDLNNAPYNEEELTPVEKEEAPSTEQTSSASPSSSCGGSFGGTTTSTSSSNKKTDSTDLENLSLEELKAERENKQDEVNDARDEVSQAYTDKDEVLTQIEEDYKKAVEKDEKISDETKKEFADKMDEISAKEKEICGINLDINEVDGQISNTESTISADESNISALESALSQLDSESTDDPEKQAEISAKQAELQGKLDDAKIKRDADKDSLKTLNTQKEELEKNLKDQEDILKRLEDEKSEIEEDILKNCSEETKQAYDDYNTQKSAIEEVFEKDLSNAQDKLEKATDDLNEIDELINKKESEEVQKENKVSVSSLKDGIFKEGGALYGKEDLVAEAADRYGIEPELLAAIICLETGYGTSSLAVNHNNFGGVTGSGDNGSVNASTGYTFASYSSVEVGLDAMAKNLSEYPSRYPNEVSAVNIDNIDAIGSHYCPGGTWPGKIKALYNQIKNS